MQKPLSDPDKKIIHNDAWHIVYFIQDRWLANINTKSFTVVVWIFCPLGEGMI